MICVVGKSGRDSLVFSLAPKVGVGCGGVRARNRIGQDSIARAKRSLEADAEAESVWQKLHTHRASKEISQNKQDWT